MALASATAVCRDDAADPRLLGRRSLGGKKQYEEKFRLEAPLLARLAFPAPDFRHES